MTSGTTAQAPVLHPLPEPWYRPPAVRPDPAWWRRAIGAVAGVNLLIALALWAGNHGPEDLSGAASGLNSIGRLSAMFSAQLLIAQVILIARIPVVERSFGQDRLVAWHRLTGFTSLALLAVHLGATTLGHALTKDQNPLTKFFELIWYHDGTLLAAAATVLFGLVGFTSVRAARRRLRYESWHLLHLYAYLGLLLALPHAIWTGTDLSSSRGTKLYWVGLHAAALGAVLIWRVAVPVGLSVKHRLVVERVVPESPGVVSIYLTGRDLHALGASAGQFFTWRFRSGPGWTRGHPFSLSEAPRGDRLRITVKDLGDGSHALTELRPGARALIEGPYGRLHPGVRTRQKVTLIGAGIGIAPLRALLEALDVAPGDLTMICRVHDEESLALRGEIDALATSSGARAFYVVGPRVTDRASWLPVSAAHLTDVQALRELVPDIAGHDVFICGADAWMDAVRAAALEAGVPSAAIHRERFSW